MSDLADPGLAQIDDVLGLPRVMLIGDSISIGYTPVVRQLLAGRANIHHPPENCADSAYGVRKIDEWLGKKSWDVIHFNFGLHDAKHLDAQGKYVDPTLGKQVATIEQYEGNIKALVARLQETNARLMWCSTTPIPANSLARIRDDEQRYNAAAAKIMAAEKIPMNDLWAVVRKSPFLQLPENVHFSTEGYSALGEAVAAAIRPLLPH